MCRYGTLGKLCLNDHVVTNADSNKSHGTTSCNELYIYICRYSWPNILVITAAIYHVNTCIRHWQTANTIDSPVYVALWSCIGCIDASKPQTAVFDHKLLIMSLPAWFLALSWLHSGFSVRDYAPLLMLMGIPCILKCKHSYMHVLSSGKLGCGLLWIPDNHSGIYTVHTWCFSLSMGQHILWILGFTTLTTIFVISSILPWWQYNVIK